MTVSVLFEVADLAKRPGGVGQLGADPRQPKCALSGGDSERGAESDLGVMNIADEADLSHVLCNPWS